MHVTTFAIKAAHLRSLAMLRAQLKPFARLGLTPARVDLLHLLRSAFPFSLRQCEIRRRLGVSAPTTHRMVKRLEALGFVRRSYPLGPRRCSVVRLTRAGKAAIRVVARKIIGARVVDRALRSIFRGPPGALRRHHAPFLMELRRFAGRLGDASSAPYLARILGERPRLWPFPPVDPEDL